MVITTFANISSQDNFQAMVCYFSDAKLCEQN